MHEVSLGRTIRDYLTGEQVEQTTYEDLRQALARILVEEKGYPASSVRAKVGVHFPVTGSAGSASPASSVGSVGSVDSAGVAGDVRDNRDDGEETGAEEYCRTVDLAVYDADGRPMLILLFCPGQVNTYRRESLAAARLFPGGPVPLVLITDTKDAMLVGVQKDEVLGEGMHGIPVWSWLERLVQEHPVLPLSQERVGAERRILHTYSEFIKTCCDESLCML